MKRLGALLFTLSLITTANAEPLSWDKIRRGGSNLIEKGKDEGAKWAETLKARNAKERAVAEEILADAKAEAKRVAERLKPEIKRIGQQIETETNSIYKRAESRASTQYNEWKDRAQKKNAAAKPRLELANKLVVRVTPRIFAVLNAEIAPWQDGVAQTPDAEKVLAGIDSALAAYNLATKDLPIIVDDKGNTILHVLAQAAIERNKARAKAINEDQEDPVNLESATETAAIVISILSEVSSLAATKNQAGLTPVGMLLAEPSPDMELVGMIATSSADPVVNAEVKAWSVKDKPAQ